MVAGVLIGVVFVRRQRRLTSPLLDLGLFANPSFRRALATMLTIGIVMAGVGLMSTLYLQAVLGLSPLRAGLWLVPQNIAMAAGSMVAPALARRIRPGYLMAAGLLVAGFGLLVQTNTDAVDGVAAVVVGLTLAGLGISPTMALTMNLLLGSAPPEKAGSAASISETSGEFGVAVGVAVLGSLAAVAYRAHLTIPSATPAGADNAARQGVTQAIIAAQHLPGPLGADLLDAARTAFTAGLTTVAGIGAAVFIGLAVVTAIAFRHVSPTGAAPQATGTATEARADADQAPPPALVPAAVAA